MNILTYPSAEQTAKEIASRIQKEIDSCPNEYHLVISGGINAPILYKALSDSAIDWSKVHVYFAFEYIKGPRKGFNFTLAKGHLFDKVALAPEHIHPIIVPNGEETNIAESYSELVCKLVPSVNNHPRFNALLLEMHDDGRIAGYLPGDEDLYHAQEAYIINDKKSTEEAYVTLTCEAMGSSKSIIYYAFGERVRYVVGNMINLMSEAKLYPANYVQALYPWVYLYSDKDAMREKTYSIY